MAKLAAKGTVLAYESATSTYTTIPGVQDFDLPVVGSRDEIDVTSHDSSGDYEETVLGIIRTQEISVPMVWDGTNAHHAAMLAHAQAGTSENFKVTAKDTKTYSFAAYVKAVNISFPVNGAQTATMTLKVTGAITVA